ncbi:MAG: LysM peptidoglycan-binding domain-containing protein [Patescibacteria group bacterium]|nr:LysM peptidoglycan-binding domain-containing protein [Patescibacteria group bacterium]
MKAYFKQKEKQALGFIKDNRTKIFLDFFREHSAVIVVVFVTLLITVGNTISNTERGGFLFSFFRKEASNEEKIQRRVKSHATKGNLTMVSLATVNDNESDDDLAEAMIKDGNLSQNQMQFQVLTATTPDAKELLDRGADVAVYQVEDGDTVGSIAEEFGVTTNTILWANDIDNPNKIMPGDKIFILPVIGVRHVVKSGDNLDKIAKKYEADKQKIIDFNDLTADGAVKEGEELVIPDGRIEQPATPSNLLQRRDYYSSGVAEGTSRGPSIIDRKAKGGHRFPWGHCTWYVAQSKYVPWGGNAGTWFYHARAYGAKTGKKAKKGAIIVTSESWYGHVGIVTKVKGSSVTIREMNYKGFGVESSRTISTKNRVIKGYIY